MKNFEKNILKKKKNFEKHFEKKVEKKFWKKNFEKKKILKKKKIKKKKNLKKIFFFLKKKNINTTILHRQRVVGILETLCAFYPRVIRLWEVNWQNLRKIRVELLMVAYVKCTLPYIDYYNIT